MIIILLLIAGCGFVSGYCASALRNQCPRQILGYDCRDDFCNHSKNEVDKAKDTKRRRDPPTSFKFRT